MSTRLAAQAAPVLIVFSEILCHTSLMLSYGFYKVLHLVSIFSVFLALGAVTLNTINGGDKKYPFRKWVLVTHGVGSVLALVAGFGLLARLGLVGGFPGWVWAKLVIWLVFGLVVGLIPRVPKLAPVLWIGVIILGSVAGYLAQFKPF